MVESYRELPVEENTETTADTVCLSSPLKCLFALNGFTLALPMQALLYLLNDRVAMPIPMIPVYSAMAFLPFSLRPLYAYVSGASTQRFVWITALLILCAIITGATAFTSNTWIFILLGFLRGISTSWPEFLLGLTLLQEAHAVVGEWEHRVAEFQAQAATSRNAGSLLAGIGGALIIHSAHLSMSQSSTVLLMLSGATNLIAAVVAFVSRIGSNENPRIIENEATLVRLETDSYGSCSSSSTEEEEDEEETIAGPVALEMQAETLPTQRSTNTKWIILLQFLVVLLGLRVAMVGTVRVIWDSIITGLLLLCGYFAWYSWDSWSWKPHHFAGLFLLSKAAVPTASVLLASYIYTLLKNDPTILQLFYLIDSGVLCLASWTYGKWFSRFSSGRAFLCLITVTTILGALATLLNLILLRVNTNTARGNLYLTILMVKVVSTWIGEWQFLPNLVVASVHSSVVVAMDNSSTTATQSTAAGATTALRYGILVSCIDVGNQVGAILTGSFLSILHVTRGNDDDDNDYDEWTNLDQFLWLCALLSLVSVSLVLILLLR